MVLRDDVDGAPKTQLPYLDLVHQAHWLWEAFTTERKIMYDPRANLRQRQAGH